MANYFLNRQRLASPLSPQRENLRLAFIESPTQAKTGLEWATCSISGKRLGRPTIRHCGLVGSDCVAVGAATGAGACVEVGAEAGAAVGGRLLDVGGADCACGAGDVEVIALSGFNR